MEKPYSSSRYYFLYLIFSLLLVYALQDFLTSRNTTGQIDLYRGKVHIILSALIFSLGIYFVISTAANSIIISFIKSLLWLIFWWIFIVNILQETFSWGMAVQLGLSLLWVFVYHLFSSYIRRFPEVWPIIKIGILIMFGFYCFSACYGAYTIGKSYDRIAVVNLVYNVLVFLPWIALFSNVRLRRLFIFIVALVVFFSMKRGALVVFPVMLSVGIMAEALSARRNFKGILKIIISIVIIFLSIAVVDHITGGFLLDRFSLENLSSGSGRVEIYSIIIEILSESSPWILMFGSGSGAVEQTLGMAAHNEWLGFIYNYGIVGVIFYAMLMISLIYRLVVLIKKSSRCASGFAMAVVYMFVVGMFGQIYFAHSTFYIMAFLGSVEGLIVNEMRNVQAIGVIDAQYRQQGAIR